MGRERVQEREQIYICDTNKANIMILEKPRILCVDDDPANLKLLEAALVPRGYEVIKAVIGREALEKINEQRRHREPYYKSK